VIFQGDKKPICVSLSLLINIERHLKGLSTAHFIGQQHSPRPTQRITHAGTLFSRDKDGDYNTLE
jgi:hypothetical protein